MNDSVQLNKILENCIVSNCTEQVKEIISNLKQTKEMITEIMKSIPTEKMDEGRLNDFNETINNIDSSIISLLLSVTDNDDIEIVKAITMIPV